MTHLAGCVIFVEADGLRLTAYGFERCAARHFCNRSLRSLALRAAKPFMPESWQRGNRQQRFRVKPGMTG